MESRAPTKFADYQNFARTFGVDDYTDPMSSTRANQARLADSADLKGRWLGESGFGATPLRQVLFAVWKTRQQDSPREGLAYLRTENGADYWGRKGRLTEIADYLRVKNTEIRPQESAAALLLGEALRMDRM